MAKKKFPYSMFQVTTSMNIKEIVLTGKAMGRGWRGSDYERTGYEVDSKGRQYYLKTLFETRAQAITIAERMLAEQEARLKKSQENLARRQANLAKAKAA
jgi:hypothetical protein